MKSFTKIVPRLFVMVPLLLVGCATTMPGSFNLNELRTPEQRESKAAETKERVAAMKFANEQSVELFKAGDAVRFDFPDRGKAYSYQFLGMPAAPGVETPGAVSYKEYATSGSLGSVLNSSVEFLAKRTVTGEIKLSKDEKGNYIILNKGEYAQDTPGRSVLDRTLPAFVNGMGVQILKMLDGDCSDGSCGGGNTFNLQGGTGGDAAAVNKQSSAIKATLGSCDCF